MEKTAKLAVLGIAEELRNMEVGDIIQFPIDKYNYNSVRATPSTTLVPDRAAGKAWRTRLNIKDKCTEVIRIS